MGGFFVRLFICLFVHLFDPPVGHLARTEAQPARPQAQPARPQAQPARPQAQTVTSLAQPDTSLALPATTLAQPATPLAQQQPIAENRIEIFAFSCLKSRLPSGASRKQLTSYSSTPSGSPIFFYNFFQHFCISSNPLQKKRIEIFAFLCLKSRLPSGASRKQLTSRSSTPSRSPIFRYNFF